MVAVHKRGLKINILVLVKKSVGVSPAGPADYLNYNYSCETFPELTVVTQVKIKTVGKFPISPLDCDLAHAFI